MVLCVLRRLLLLLSVVFYLFLLLLFSGGGGGAVLGFVWVSVAVAKPLNNQFFNSTGAPKNSEKGSFFDVSTLT